MKQPLMTHILFVGVLLYTSIFKVYAEDNLKPYILAAQKTGTAAAEFDAVKTALSQAEFELLGEYSPYDGAHIVAVTNEALRKAAAKSEFGGYGAAQRVAVTQVKDQVQISYTNPLYMANIYRMGDNLSAVADSLKNALDSKQAFGSKEGISASDLREYHYMIAMPYFDDHLEIAEYTDHQSALNKVENRLAGSKTVNKIYRVDIPGKEESVFGVSIMSGDGADKTVMEATDTETLKHTAHLPYELLVSGKKAYILHGKFRIAQSFPDLGMGTFMKISSAPDAIELIIKEAIK